MTTRGAQVEAAFGFLTIFQQPAAGYFGGYLVIDARGRPMEFHCTAPILPSRAEEILYGPTLESHLYCERLGQSLLASAKTVVRLILVNQIQSLALADELPIPVVLIDPKPPGGSDWARAAGAASACLDRVDQSLKPMIEQDLERLGRYIEIAEPFDRIVEAIQEAGQFAVAAPTQHGDEDPRDQAA